MPFEIKMPMLSPTMESGKLVRWVKKEGEQVNYEDIVAEIETDKTTMEVVSYSEGILYKILVPENTTSVPVNKAICILLLEGEKESEIDINKYNDNNTVHTPENILNPTPQDFANIGNDTTVITNNNANISKQDNVDLNINIKKNFITPVARKLLKENGISLDDNEIYNITNSTNKNRITKSDIEKVLHNQKKKNSDIDKYTSHNILYSNGNITQPSKTIKIPVSPMRKAISDRLFLSKTSIPHFYLKNTCCVDKLLKLRSEINSNIIDDNENTSNTKITINDFLVKASAMALKDSPKMNTFWDTDNIIQYQDIDVSVAVSLEDGLITPIVRSADKKSISQISQNIKDLAKRARSGKLDPSEYQGGGLTVSNLGMYGVEECFSIINPPQVAILAIGALRQELSFTVLENGTKDIIEKNVITVTMSCDHRVADGSIATAFFQKFKYYIENPMLILI